MEEELSRLRSQAELHRMQTAVIATLEGERAALERDRDTLRSSVDSLRTAQRKVGEQTYTNIRGETNEGHREENNRGHSDWVLSRFPVVL